MLTPAQQLVILAERCETYVKSEMWMTGKDADQALNEAIAVAKGMKRTVAVGHEVLGNVRMVPAYLPNFVNSIDAAVTLVPKGWAWMCGCTMGEGFFADIAPTDESEIEADGIMANAASPALALCAASLRARAAEAK